MACRAAEWNASNLGRIPTTNRKPDAAGQRAFVKGHQEPCDGFIGKSFGQSDRTRARWPVVGDGGDKQSERNASQANNRLASEPSVGGGVAAWRTVARPASKQRMAIVATRLRLEDLPGMMKGKRAGRCPVLCEDAEVVAVLPIGATAWRLFTRSRIETNRRDDDRQPPSTSVLSSCHHDGTTQSSP